MASKDVGSAEVKCPDNSIAVFLKCLDAWEFTELVHVRLSGDKEGTDETKNKVDFSDLVKGSYKIELTLKGDDALYKEKEAFLKSSFSPLKRLTLERKEGEEETTLKADVPLEKEPDEMAVLINFQPPCHGVSSIAFADPDNPDVKTPSYTTIEELREADMKEKTSFKAEAEDLKIAWEMSKDDDQLKAEFVKKAQVSIFNNDEELIWFDYIEEDATKEAEKGEIDWKGDINASELKGVYTDDLAPSTFSPFLVKMAIKQGVGKCKREETWSYLERACILKLLLYRGPAPRRETKFNLGVFDTEDNLKGGAPLCELKEVSSLQAIMNADIPAKFSIKTMLVGVKFLDEKNKETGEGLVLKIEDPGEIAKPSVASQRLQCLGYYKDPNLLTEESVEDVKERKYLDFYSVWADYQRGKGEPAVDLKDADWEPLEEEYWNYQYLNFEIPADPVEPADLEPTVLIKVRLVRGEELFVGKCRVEVGAYHIDNLEIGGYLEIEVPAKCVERAKIVKVYYLDEEGNDLDDGLLLCIKEPETIGKITGSSWRLKALGFYNKPALTAETIDDKDFYDLYSATSGYQRTKAYFPTPPKELPWEALERDYWEYEYQPPELLTVDVKPAENLQEYSVIVEAKVLRGSKPFTGDCRIEIGPYHIDTQAISGELNIEAPKQYVDISKLIKIYYLDEEGQTAGEGLILRLQQPRVTGDITGGSARLRSMGFYNRTSLIEGEEVDHQKFWGLYSAVSGYQRSEEQPATTIEGASWNLVEEDYWEYEYRPISLPYLDFPDDQSKALRDAADNAMPLCEN